MSTFLESASVGWLSVGLHVIGKSALLLSIAALVALMLRRHSAAARHLVWCLALAGSLILPLFVVLAPGWNWSILPDGFAAAPPSRTASVPDAPAAAAFVDRELDPSSLQNHSPALVNSAAHPTRELTVSRAVASPHRSSALEFTKIQPLSNPPVLWVVCAWLVPMAAILAVPIFGRVGLFQLRRSARPILGRDWECLIRQLRDGLGFSRHIVILCSDHATMPMTWGYLRPVVLLPAESEAWSIERRRDVLLHELAHVKRWDCLTQTIAQFACALYWFNPMVWVASRRMRIERERACDDLVLQAGTRPSEYAGHLLEMARVLRSPRSSSVAAIAMARPSQLEGRLLAILDPSRNRHGLNRIAAAVAAIAVLAVLFPMSAVQLAGAAKAPRGTGVSPKDSRAKEADRMIATGRVLDPDGKPVKEATVEIIGRRRTVLVTTTETSEGRELVGRGETDGDGRFRIDANRTSSDHFFNVHALAAASGFGTGWAELNPDAEQPAADIRLRPEQQVRVKLVDVNGQPASNVQLVVTSFGRPTDIGLYDGFSLYDRQLDGLRTWPQPSTTNDEGIFTVTGIGRDLQVGLHVRDMRYARQWLTVETGSGGASEFISLALAPAMYVEGRVLAADTGQPIPNAIVAVASGDQEFIGSGGFKVRADDQGRYRVNSRPNKHYSVRAYPPDGQPYSIAELTFDQTRGVIRKEIDIKLPRGVILRGKVMEEGTGRVLAGSSVQFYPKGGRDQVIAGWQAIVASDAVGSFQIVVPPGKGHLFVFGPTADFVRESIAGNRLYSDKPGGPRHYAHKIVSYDVSPGTQREEMSVALQPAKPVPGRVVGPEGQTVVEAGIISTLKVSQSQLMWRGDLMNYARDGRFTLRGVDPDKATPVYFVDFEHEWGAAIEVTGKQAGEELTVRLRPCGSAKLRLVDPDGKPVANRFPNFEILGTPGPSGNPRQKPPPSEPDADAAYVVNVDRKHYWKGLRTDSEGRISLPNLIPGALYRISDFSTVNDDKGVQVRRDFTVKSGETLDLGDILMERPRA
jgi:beta-lactamase regulating signal transducer with metallopeptidase domain